MYVANPFEEEVASNKWYRMTERDDGTFLAQWGRVGAEGQSKVYPVDKWDSQLRSKLAKGYTQVAGHGSAVASARVSDIDVEDEDVKDLLSFLLQSAKQTVSLNYLSAGEVTEAQINQAQGLLGSLKVRIGSPADEINVLLERLYRTIPRKMTNTFNYFLRPDYKTQFLFELLQSEQALLDTLESQRVGSGSGVSLDALGLDVRVATQVERDEVLKRTDFRVSRQRIFRVSNRKTRDSFQALFGSGRDKLLYHGTRNGNWLSVLQHGLRIRPAGVPTTGSMFGDGVYFANKARKSIGYTSLKGSRWAGGADVRAYLAIFEVCTGCEWDLLKGQKWQSWMGRIDAGMVRAKGYDSVFARGGVDLRNDEYVIYDSSRCNIKYLIELSSRG
jgi:poly [ADP-ribose] polymerase